MSLKIALERIRKAKEENAIELDLSELGLSKIPKKLSELRQLTDLDLSRNQLTEIKGLTQLTQLEGLRLRNNKIIEIKGLEELTRLRHLVLPGNHLKEIKGVDHLTRLTYLDLSANQIPEIKGLSKLTRLTYLNLDFNRLKNIKGLEQLAKLTTLYLSGNQLTELKGLERFKRLSKLGVRDNRLTGIDPTSLPPNLKTLYLNGNQLAETTFLKNLPNLTNLWIARNKLTYLPEVLLDLNQPILWKGSTSEKAICVANNPFTDPPPEIIKQGNDAIREYFEQRKKGEELLLEAKLILLGDGRSGKTSFANRLLGKELPQEADRTQGVDIAIGEYEFPLANGKTFKLNIWDFAGQDKYKTLHQLFYTESSLYVMVAESGNMGTDYDDWFQTAELFGEGSPLVLVLNEFKEGIGMGSFDSSYWKKQFPELLKEVFTVNLGTKNNFSTAEEYLQLLAQTLPHTKYEFPSNWAAIRRVLNARRDEQYITLQEYLKVCAENDLPKEESALVLSSVLHKIGDCLHYQKSELLNQLVILKNEWATEAVYKILDDEIVAEKQCGFFSMKDVKRIWSSSEYKFMRPQLLELMKQFKLAYQLPGKEEFVTPPLLPPARPAHFTWPELDSLELYIEYEFLPKALLTQFIVSRHVDIAESRTLVWRHGVVLEWEGEALGEVSKTKLQGKDAIYIRTQGENRKGMMTVILKTLRDLHAEYKGIKYEEKVPCICEGCKEGKNKQYYFDFAHLKLRVEKGRLSAECDKSLNTVNVLELLENTFVLERIREGYELTLDVEAARPTSTAPKVLKLFLASSFELKTEREKIEQALNRKNKILREQGFTVDLRIWEDGKHIGTSLRSQDNYNLEIEQCDLFAMLFYSKVGKYALEEFKLAKSLYEKEETPRICIFQKDKDLPRNLKKADADSRYAFLDLLEKLEHFPTLFQNEDQLVNQLEDVIDKLLLDEAFVKRLTVA